MHESRPLNRGLLAAQVFGLGAIIPQCSPLPPFTAYCKGESHVSVDSECSPFLYILHTACRVGESVCVEPGKSCCESAGGRRGPFFC